jgi:methylmalonyl-CoA mutase
MDIGTEVLKIREDFPPVSTDEWERAIHEDLKGADYEKKLVWKTDEGIAVKPYYRAEDTAQIEERRLGFPQTWTITESTPQNAIRADLVSENGGTAVQELAFGMAQAADRLAADPSAQVSFVFNAGTNFFFEIAKLRAARLLWANIANAFGLQDSSARIHVHTALSNKSQYDPYTNLLRATTEALSAAFGGCDTLHVRPFRFSARLAVNVQRILQEEAHLDRVTDPGAGSYYIEALTEAMAREAWKLFQQVEAHGGYSKARAFVEESIAASRAAREKALSSRRRTLVGVNNYPDINETLGDEAAPEPPGIWRAAALYEKIRRRTEAHSRRTGKRPKVLLLTRGDLKMRMARAQFCQNLFGCGGFAIEESHDYAASDAELIVLCSSDPEYLAVAQEVCPAVRQPVIVAGNPKEHAEALQAAGVAGFVHILSDAVETLTYWQDRLGIGGDRQ